MILEEHERERFCEYLRLQIASTKGVIGQLETVPFEPSFIERWKERAAALTFVLEDLESTEEMVTNS